MLELGVPPLQESLDGKRRCPVCTQLRTTSDKTTDGQIHRVLGRSNKIWCPYADDKSILETFEKEQKQRTQAAWQRANEAKRLKKSILETFEKEQKQRTQAAWQRANEAKRLKKIHPRDIREGTEAKDAGGVAKGQ